MQFSWWPGRAGQGVWLTLLTLAGCSGPPPVATLPPAKVTVATPVVSEIQDFEEFTGRAEGSQAVQVRARVSGYLDRVAFKPGAFIESGSDLFDIDPRPYQAAFDQATANLAQAQARESRATKDAQRAKELVDKKVMTAQEWDKVSADLLEATAQVKSAEAALETANLNLGFTKIRAPISGIVSRELITPGNLVQADQTILTSVIAYDPVYLYFDIDERIVLRILQLIREGKFKSARENVVPITAAIGDSDGFPFEGFVNFVDNQIDPTTGTMRVRGEFPNPRLAGGAVAITPGMFIRIRLPMGTPYEAVRIHRRAVVSDQDRKLVYVVNGNQEVEPREVKLGPVGDGGLQVVQSGLKADETIVISGLQRVRPRSKVDPKPGSMTAGM